MNRPGAGEYESVIHYLDGTQTLPEKQSSYIRWREDLVTLRPGREHAWLDRAIEKSLKFTRCRPIDVSRSFLAGGSMLTLEQYMFCDQVDFSSTLPQNLAQLTSQTYS